MCPGSYSTRLGRGFSELKGMKTYLDELWDAVGVGLGAGRILYVDGNAGSDGYSGLPDYPLKTILKAQTLSEDGRGDYIIVLNHYQETFPITITKSLLHIIALNVGQPMVWLTASADTAIFEIEADFVEIAGFEFGAGASHAAIEFTASKGYGRIHHNVFGWMQAGQDGIKVVAPFEAAETIIERNLFGNSLTRDGVRIDHAMTRGLIQKNIFRSVPGIGINVVSQISLGTIRKNEFMLPSDVAGKAITLGANNTGVFVVDNEANFGDTDSMVAIPYVDGGGADVNTWSNNKRNGAVVNPA